MRRLLPFLILIISLLNACKDSSQSASHDAGGTTKSVANLSPTSALDTATTNELMNMIHVYYSLKDALVAGSGTEADKNASRLMYAGENFKLKVASSPKNNDILPLVKTVISKSDAISSSKPDSIEYKRAQFAEISDAIFKIAGAANLQHAGIYRAFCPMAFDNKGAFWLSQESEIRNPYFGKKMLECGEVRDSL